MNTARSFSHLRESIRARHEPGAMRILSIYYWRTLICAALLLSFGAIFWGWWEFNATRAILDTRNDPAQSQAPILTRKMVEDAIDRFAVRKAGYEQLRVNPVPAPNPGQ
ncbi:hypothetical protein C4568_04450 [Candidatus Parcubacteria bacterium]|nr:MAG: hypothetical protein C4568_04450 [Candidatus Parcubacteria bacterium]